MNEVVENKPDASFTVLGIRIDPVQIPYVVEQVKRWISNKDGTRFITLTNVHSVMEAQHNGLFRETLRNADLSVPDGMPLVWLGRRHGHILKRRVYGPDLLWTFCSETGTENIKHYFYGGADGVPEKLAGVLKKHFPQLNVVGSYSPPFHALTREEDGRILDMINQSGPDIIWVGLGCPKQEIWMYEHRKMLNAPVMIGVGAAFDFFTGQVRQAPLWMRENGLEWLFRLIQEPKRLWRRYLIYNSQFIISLFLEAVGLKKFS